jgi:hypothetical protein
VLALAGAIAVALLVGDRRALHVVDVSPSAGAADVSLASQIFVTFSRPLDPSVPPGAFAMSPATDGLVSVAGRRAAFTPRRRLQADTVYTVTIGHGIRDRGGRALADVIVSTFRTRPLAALARVRERGLVRMSLGGDGATQIGGPIGDFAVAPSGAIAWVDPTRQALVVQRPRAAPTVVPLPDGLAIEALEWAPTESALLFLGSRAGGSGEPFVVRLDASPSVQRLGDAGGGELPAALVIERLKRSLVEVVYGRDSYAVAPGGAIVRDRSWDFVLVDLDGRRRARLGSFLAVGDAAPAGTGLLVVDIDPADPALRRGVALYDREGRLRPLSPTNMDTHSPRFSHGGDEVIVATAAAAGPPRRRRYGLAVIDVATARHRSLTAPPAGMSDGDPRWSPDDGWLMFRRTSIDGDAAPQVWIVPVTGGEPRPLAANVDAARWIP